VTFLGGWGRFVYRRRWLVLALSALGLGASIASMVAGGTLRNVPFRETEAGRASKLVQDELPRDPGAPATSSFVLVFTSREGLDSTDPRFIQAMRAALAPLQADTRVVSITTPDGVPPPQATALRSKDGKRALANVVLMGTFSDWESSTCSRPGASR
jgi:uncharacterized membrane protein YdfJ with MMPL/SSD domain